LQHIPARTSRLSGIVKAASDLQREYVNRSYPVPSLAIAQDRITKGIVTLNAFSRGLPQILLSGRLLHQRPANISIAGASHECSTTIGTNAATTASSTNAVRKFPVTNYEIRGDNTSFNRHAGVEFTKYTERISLLTIFSSGLGLQLEYGDRGFPTGQSPGSTAADNQWNCANRVFIGRLSKSRSVEHIGITIQLEQCDAGFASIQTT